MRKLLFLLGILIGCSENDTTIRSSDPLTIEGQIQENQFATIYLTNSLAFEGVIDSLTIAKSIESKAKVMLSDGNNSEILTLKRDDSRFPFLFYRSNIIKGETGRKYNLSIEIRGKKFISETVLPKKAEIESIDFIEASKDGIKTPDFRDIKLTINNSTPSKTMYFKVLIKKEEEAQFFNASPFIFNTENIFTDTFPLIITYSKRINGSEVNQLKINETIEIQLVAISKEQFDFWKSVKGDQTTIIDNSSFSSEITTNISNGAFGYWSGENVTNLKFTIPQ